MVEDKLSPAVLAGGLFRGLESLFLGNVSRAVPVEIAGIRFSPSPLRLADVLFRDLRFRRGDELSGDFLRLGARPAEKGVDSLCLHYVRFYEMLSYSVESLLLLGNEGVLSDGLRLQIGYRPFLFLQLLGGKGKLCAEVGVLVSESVVFRLQAFVLRLEFSELGNGLLEQFFSVAFHDNIIT